MTQVRQAAPSKAKIVPAFTVEKLDGDREAQIITFDQKGQRQTKTTKVPAGFLVKFPRKGHSIRIGTVDELKRLGFDRTVPLVDEDDEVVGHVDNRILEDIE